jgi:hypothetical protein
MCVLGTEPSSSRRMPCKAVGIPGQDAKEIGTGGFWVRNLSHTILLLLEDGGKTRRWVNSQNRGGRASLGSRPWRLRSDGGCRHIVRH